VSITTAGAEVSLGPVAGIPDGHAQDEWVIVAREIAAQLAPGAPEREAAGKSPLFEAELFREAGLLGLLGPVDAGGQARPYAVALTVIRQLAQVDSGLARLLAYHYAWSHRLGTDLLAIDRYRDFERRVTENRWLVGSTGSPLDADLTVERTPAGALRISGTKFFCTGALVADRIICFASDPDGGERLVIELDARRPEIEFLADWDILGERLSASNGLTLHGYEASPQDVLGSLGLDDTPRPPHRTLSILSFQLIFVHLLLGTAEGALLAARDYTTTRTRAWIHAGVESATEDPHILATYGELVSQVQALAGLAERAEHAAAWALARGTELTPEERAQAATLGAAAKVVATRVSLDTTSRVFETTGARSAKRAVGLDRFWRNARTETLHSPVAYKLEEVGGFFLNGTIATPSDYR
jgi:alkylation response protein AidB-like acyl-CoA dehydrogenase